MAILIVVFLIAFFMRFDFVAEPLAGALGTTAEKVREVAGHIMLLALSFLLLVAGIALAGALPFVAVGLVLVGAALAAFEVWGLLRPVGNAKKGDL